MSTEDDDPGLLDNVIFVHEACAMAIERAAALKRAIDTGAHNWGRWTFVREGGGQWLVLDGHYDIEITRIGEMGLAHWLIHLTEKNWVTPDDLGQLVLAVRDLVRIDLMKDPRQRAVK
jgi:hypothetical protein